MNWKIILQLSLFGFIMAAATVSLIPFALEPFFWLVIFLFSAYVIAKTCSGAFFLNGFMVSMVNCVYIIAAHVTFYHLYMKSHPEMAKMPVLMAGHPRLSMVLAGVVAGVISGLILGLFAFVASKIIHKRPAVA
jgi:hypothetical protein